MPNVTTGYSLKDYGDMITDNRAGPYIQAIKAAVKPGSVVLEIGTGSGFFAVLACKLGAKRVYAIEPDDSIIVAAQVARDNGCAGQIEFIQAISSEITLPEKADVMISDLRGVVPLLQHHISAIADARERLLKPNGIQIPLKDTIQAALVSDPESYGKYYCSPWQDAPHGCDLSANRRFIVNTWRKTHLKPEQLLVEPQTWAVLDYTSRVDPNVKNTLTWQITESGTIHGFGLWFDADLTPEIGFSNAPGQPQYIYGNAFFPMEQPIDVVPGDMVTLKLQAKLIGDDYVWSWQTQVAPADAPNNFTVNLQQSTFFGLVRSAKSLQKQADIFLPQLNDLGKLDRLILNLMAEGKPLGDIATDVAQQFPQRFSAVQAALSYVGELSQKYSQ